MVSCSIIAYVPCDSHLLANTSTWRTAKIDKGKLDHRWEHKNWFNKLLLQPHGKELSGSWYLSDIWVNFSSHLLINSQCILWIRMRKIVKQLLLATKYFCLFRAEITFMKIRLATKLLLYIFHTYHLGVMARFLSYYVTDITTYRYKNKKHKI